MSWVGRLFGAGGDARPPRDPLDDFWYKPLLAQAAAGEHVTIESAMSVPVVYDCLMTLGSTIGALPWAMFERSGENKKRAEAHPLATVLGNPNPECDSVEFLTQMVIDLAGEGEFFAQKVPGALGPVTELWRMEPSRVVVEKIPQGADGGRRFRYREPGRPEVVLMGDEVWHIRRPPIRDGLRGTSPILHAGREVIAAAIAVQKYGARFFANDATPPFVLTHPGNFKDADGRETFLKAISRWWGGENRHKPAMLEWGIDIKKVGATNEEAQFLETRKELAYEIARLWRMPPHKVGLLERATNNNIEHQSLEFVIDTLLPWLRMIERSISKHLLVAPGRYFFEFNVAGLLRGDIKSRYEAHALARNWGWLSVNEIRAMENLNPIGPEGDVYLQPMNMSEAGAPAAEAPPARPVQPDPGDAAAGQPPGGIH